MRAVDIHGGKGPASALFINENTPKPVPKPNQALIKIKAFGLNRMDMLQREGRYIVPPQAPATLGVEFSGTVETLGTERETSFQIGDEVFGLAYGGCYAQYVAVSTRTLIHKPQSISWEEAAGVPETWITALQAMYVVGGYRPGQSMLWHAGAGGVALSGIQLAKAGGASGIYVTASTQEKINFCKSVGATEGISYKEGDWAEGPGQAHQWQRRRPYHRRSRRGLFQPESRCSGAGWPYRQPWDTGRSTHSTAGRCQSLFEEEDSVRGEYAASSGRGVSG